MPTERERIDRLVRRMDMDTGEVRRLTETPTIEMPAPPRPPALVVAARDAAERQRVPPEDVAAAVGVRPGTVRAWWAGRRIPGADRLERVYAFLRLRFTVTPEDPTGPGADRSAP